MEAGCRATPRWECGSHVLGMVLTTTGWRVEVVCRLCLEGSRRIPPVRGMKDLTAGVLPFHLSGERSDWQVSFWWMYFHMCVWAQSLEDG